MPPSAVSDMMAMLAFDALGGQDAEDGRTVFSREGGGTRVGETITTLPFSLSSDPFEQGIAVHPVRRHRGQRLGGLRLRQRPARARAPTGCTRACWPGCATTGPARRGPVSRWRPTSTTWCCAAATATAGSVDDMVARTERGLLLTCLWYIREVDPATLLCTRA